MEQQLSEVDAAICLVETFVDRLVSLLLQLAVNGRQSKVTRRIAGAFPDVVVVEQHAHHSPVESRQNLNHDSTDFPVVG